MTCVNMLHVELNEIINNMIICIYIIFINIVPININNATTLLNHKISHKMTMPHKLVWMNENFM